MAEPSMFNLYDVATAENQNARTNAMNVAQLPAGRATVYGAGLAGSMLSGGINQMLGRVTPQQQKAEIVNGIMKKYINADPKDPQNILMMSRDFANNDLPGLANQFMTQYQTAIAAKPAPTDTADIKNFNKAVKEGYTGSFFEYQKSFKSGNKQVSIGSVPQDFIIVTNDLGEITMEVIPGSPTDIANQAADDAGGVAAVRKSIQSGVVIEDIGRLSNAISNDSFLDPASSSILSYILENPLLGSGKNRIDALSLATTIKSSIGFDRLQQMREESPTGGALGQVSELELVTLQATLGSLDLNQSKENILYNLKRLEEIYINIFTKLQAYPNYDKYFGEDLTSNSDTEIVKNLDPLGIRL